MIEAVGNRVDPYTIPSLARPVNFVASSACNTVRHQTPRDSNFLKM